MWQQNNKLPMPPVPPMSMGVPGGMPMGMGPMGMMGGGPMMANNVDWGQAAQQWLRNKEMYEQWQQQQYQQHMQMMAAAHAATMANCIDPSVVTNPPPPPPESTATDDNTNETAELVDTSKAAAPSNDILNTNTPNRKTNQFKSRFSNSPLVANALAASANTQNNSNSKNNSLFAAYDSTNNQQQNKVNC